jgi:catechol 2,3-dioxygenase-like lactoylglutathione lyase family enzyme
MLGLRHLALRVGDVGRSTDFYTRILGMRIDWQPDEDSVYLTSGSDNLALHKSGDSGGRSPGASTGLDHFGFLVGRPEDVDGWALRLAAQGVAMEHPPRDHRDGSRSFYFRDPDGNLLQILFHPHIFEP